MIDRLKKYGEMALAMTAIFAVFSGVITFFGGHVPPWVSWAQAETLEQNTIQNTKQINQLNVLILSDKVAQIQAALAKNPGDVNLQQSLNFWQTQYQIAIQQALKK